MFWGQGLQEKLSLKSLETPGWGEGRFGIRRDNGKNKQTKNGPDDVGAGKMSLGK